MVLEAVGAPFNSNGFAIIGNLDILTSLFASLAAKAEREGIPSCHLPGSSRGWIGSLNGQATDSEE